MMGKVINKVTISRNTGLNVHTKKNKTVNKNIKSGESTSASVVANQSTKTNLKSNNNNSKTPRECVKCPHDSKLIELQNIEVYDKHHDHVIPWNGADPLSSNSSLSSFSGYCNEHIRLNKYPEEGCLLFKISDQIMSNFKCKVKDSMTSETAQVEVLMQQFKTCFSNGAFSLFEPKEISKAKPQKVNICSLATKDEQDFKSKYKEHREHETVKEQALNGFDFLCTKQFSVNYGISDTIWFEDEEMLLGSLLDDLQNPIKDLFINAPGISTSFSYLGFTYSMFGGHTEDYGGLNSCNIHYYGAQKIWIIVIPADVNKLQDKILEYITAHFPYYAFMPCILRHKMWFVHPKLLLEWGIRFQIIIQEPGMIVVTKANAFHWGYNLGTNLAKAMNLAFFDYLTKGIAPVDTGYQCECSTDSKGKNPPTNLCKGQLELLYLQGEINSFPFPLVPFYESMLPYFKEILKAKQHQLILKDRRLKSIRASLTSPDLNLRKEEEISSGTTNELGTVYNAAGPSPSFLSSSPPSYSLMDALTSSNPDSSFTTIKSDIERLMQIKPDAFMHPRNKEKPCQKYTPIYLTSDVYSQSSTFFKLATDLNQLHITTPLPLTQQSLEFMAQDQNVTYEATSLAEDEEKLKNMYNGDNLGMEQMECSSTSTTMGDGISSNSKTFPKSNDWFSCDICSSSFFNKASLKRHWNNKHNPNTVDFYCPACSYESKVFGNFLIHLVNRHNLTDIESVKTQRHLFTNKKINL